MSEKKIALRWCKAVRALSRKRCKLQIKIRWCTTDGPFIYLFTLLLSHQASLNKMRNANTHTISLRCRFFWWRPVPPRGIEIANVKRLSDSARDAAAKERRRTGAGEREPAMDLGMKLAMQTCARSSCRTHSNRNGVLLSTRTFLVGVFLVKVMPVCRLLAMTVPDKLMGSLSARKLS